MRRSFKILLTVIVGVPAVLVAAVAAAFISLALLVGGRDCGPDSPAVARAFALSQPELADLYKDMSSLVQGNPEWPPLMLEPDSNMPESTRALEPRAVHVTPDPRITLEGCFDHYVIMNFYGLPGALEAPGHEPAIELTWGEYAPQAGSKVLWRPDP